MALASASTRVSHNNILLGHLLLTSAIKPSRLIVSKTILHCQYLQRDVYGERMSELNIAMKLIDLFHDKRISRGGDISLSELHSQFSS